MRAFSLLRAMVVGLALIIATNLPSTATADVYVGALVVERGPGLDQVTGGQHVGQNFMATWRAYQSGRVRGANVHARIYLSTNGRRVTLYTGGVNGVLKLRTGENNVRQATCLCVEVRGQTSCTRPGAAYNYFRGGGGHSAADAYGVALMVP